MAAERVSSRRAEKARGDVYFHAGSDNWSAAEIVIKDAAPAATAAMRDSAQAAKKRLDSGRLSRQGRFDSSRHIRKQGFDSGCRNRDAFPVWERPARLSETSRGPLRVAMGEGRFIRHRGLKIGSLGGAPQPFWPTFPESPPNRSNWFWPPRRTHSDGV